MDPSKPDDPSSIPLTDGPKPPENMLDELNKRLMLISKSESERINETLGPNSIAADLKRRAGGPDDPLRSLRSTLDALNFTQSKSLKSLLEATTRASKPFEGITVREILAQSEPRTIEFRPPPVHFDNEFKSQAQEQLRLAKSTEELTRAALEATTKRHEEERRDAIASGLELRKARRREWIAIGIAMLFGIVGAWDPVSKWLSKLG